MEIHPEPKTQQFATARVATSQKKKNTSSKPAYFQILPLIILEVAADSFLGKAGLR